MIATRHLAVLAAAATAVAACGGSTASSAPASTSRAAAQVTVTLTPADGATATQLATAANLVRMRLSAQGITARTSVSGGAIQVSVPSSARAAVDAAARPGVLSFREIYTDASGTAYASPVATPSAEGAGSGSTVTGLDAPASEPNQTAPSPAVLAQFAALDCSGNAGRPATVDEDPHHFVVACSSNGQMTYLLTPADLTGAQVASATATQGQSSLGGQHSLWVVDLAFEDSAVSQVEQVSTRLHANNKQQLAITLDGVVITAPSTNGVLGKNIALAGGLPPFSEAEARGLAAVLRSGPLPVALTVTGT